MIALLVFMLTPWSPQLPSDQIWMGDEVDPIKAEVLDLPQGRRFAVRAFEWVQLKRRAEAMGSYCQDAVNIANSTCVAAANELIDKTRREAESTHADQEVVIDALRNDLKLERSRLSEERKVSKHLKWAIIGASALAIGATTVAIVR